MTLPQARDDAGVHRIAAEQEHHRNRYGTRSPSPESGAASDDDVDLRTQQFVGQRGEFVVIPPSVASLEDEVAALAIADNTHSLNEALKKDVGRGAG